MVMASPTPPKPSASSGFGHGPTVPGVIQRVHGGCVEWLRINIDPVEWTTQAVDAFVFPDIAIADKRAKELAKELNQLVFPAVRERVRQPSPLFLRSDSPREQMKRPDWREGVPNAGVE